MSVQNMDEKAERAQGQPGLIDFIEILVAEPPLRKGCIRILYVLGKCESRVGDLRGQFSNMLCELLALLIVKKRVVDLMVECFGQAQLRFLLLFNPHLYSLDIK